MSHIPDPIVPQEHVPKTRGRPRRAARAPASKTPAAKNRPEAPRVPKLRTHKATGQGYVVLNGNAKYLGRAGDPETERRYHQTIAEWLATGRQPKREPDKITIEELIARYWLYAQDYYRDAHGQPTGHLHALRNAFCPLKRLYGETRAAEFGPLALKAVRDHMIGLDWCRGTVNQSIGCIRRALRWGVENELIPGSVHYALTAVPGLRRGRCAAREPAPVRPVPQERIEAIEPFVSKQVWALVQLQLLSAARAGELVGLCKGNIDRSNQIWTYTPAEHKTAHHGHRRTIYFGPRAQAVLGPFLVRPDDQPLFSPQEAEVERRRALSEQRVTPLSCGNRPGSHVPRTPRQLGDRYTVGAYWLAIQRACDQAYPPPSPLAQRGDETKQAWRDRLTAKEHRQLTDWQKANRWHPHQLRHNAATELRKEFGVETARILLGHRSAAITEVYAELDREKAVDAVLQVG